jgi:hypothetical protein
VLPGASGSRPTPRKIAGSEMITIDWLIVASSTPTVVLDNVTHLYAMRALPTCLAFAK